MEDSPPRLLAKGQLLSDRFKIVGLLGEGGFAEVYEGFDQMIERRVAIKVLHSLWGGSERQTPERTLARFKREAKAAARISHGNVVTIYDMGVLDHSEHPYIVMEFLEGHDLGEELKTGGALAPPRVLARMITALDALAAGHRLGIVHRDLKPENLFLVLPGTPEEDVKILDFGIARLEMSSVRLSVTGEIFGTAAYMAPEYIVHAAVSPAVDIYQMGLILVELLSGQTVVGGVNPLSCIARHSSGDLNVPKALVEGPLGPVLLRAMAMDPDERYPDAAAFRNALREIDPASIDPGESGGPMVRLTGVTSSSPLISKIEAPDTDAYTAANEDPRQAHLSISAALDSTIPFIQQPPPEEALPEPAPVPEPEPPEPETEPVLPAKAVVEVQPLPPTPSAEPPVQRGLGVWVGVVVVMLVAAVALGFALFGGDGAPPEPGPTPKGEAVAEKATVDKAAPEPTPAPPKPEPEPEAAPEPPKAEPEPPPEPKAVVVKIAVKPANARIFQDGKPLGRAPHELTFEPGADAPVSLVVRRFGHRVKKIEVSPSDAPTVEVVLERLKQQGGDDELGIAD